MAFENEDMEVEGIGDGQEAFDRIAEFNPDIVLADVDMPGLDGFALSAKIKKASETSGIKVLLLASDFEDFDEQRYQGCGADNHISKPFKSDDIVSMVKSLLAGASGEAVSAAGADLGDAETIEQSLEGTEEVSEIISNLKVPEMQEEPSLEELLDSVEKLSTDGMGNTDEVDDGVPFEDETLALTDEEPDQPVESPAEHSADDEALDLPDLMEPVSPELVAPEPTVPEPAVPEPVAPMELADFLDDTPAPEEELSVAQPENKDDDIMDQMIRGVEELKESVLSSDPVAEEAFPFAESDEPEDMSYADGPEIFAEVGQRKMDNMDDLDSAFRELSAGGRGANHEEKRPELSSLGGIVPEPEDLLEHMAPGAFSEVSRRPSTPEGIKENLDYMSGFSDQDRDLEPRDLRSRDWSYEDRDDHFTQAIAEEVKQVLKRSLSTSLEKEVSGLSDVILKTIREVVREVTPEIARRVIREEIEKIKKQDMV